MLHKVSLNHCTLRVLESPDVNVLWPDVVAKTFTLFLLLIDFRSGAVTPILLAHPSIKFKIDAIIGNPGSHRWSPTYNNR